MVVTVAGELLIFPSYPQALTLSIPFHSLAARSQSYWSLSTFRETLPGSLQLPFKVPPDKLPVSKTFESIQVHQVRG